MKNKYILYLLRWQLSGLILAPCIMLIKADPVTVTVISNLIGGAIFFWVDKYIFSKVDKQMITERKKGIMNEKYR